MSMSERLDRFWFTPAPPLRLACLRVLIVAFGLFWLTVLAPVLFDVYWFPPEQFKPVGVVALLDRPLGLGTAVAIHVATVLFGGAALVGWKFRVSGPLYALGLLWITSYRNSWGMVFHTENLMVLHTLILAVLPAADSWAIDARGHTQTCTPGPRYAWGPKLMATVTTIAYLLAGIAKLRNGGLEWLDGDALLAHVAWDNLRKLELGAAHSTMGALLSAYPAVFAPLAWLSMVLELGAPLALFGGWIARIWAIGMWAFHLGVAAIMAIVFAYPLTGLAYAPLFAIEQPLMSWTRRVRERRPSSLLARLLPE